MGQLNPEPRNDDRINENVIMRNVDNFTGFGETKTGKIDPWVVRSLRNSPPSFTESKDDSERGRDSTPIFTPTNHNTKH